MTLSLSQKILNIDHSDVIVEPFPHILKHEFLNPDLYRRLKAQFPTNEMFDGSSQIGRRTGRDLYRGDPTYEKLLAISPAWQEFYSYLHSQHYINDTIELFGDYLQRFESLIDSEKARFVDHFETRKSLSRFKKIRRKWHRLKKIQQSLTGYWGKNNLFVRMDISQCGVGYHQGVHCDNPYRLSSMIIYFSDAEDINMKGGELTIHESIEKKAYRDYKRHPKPQNLREIKRFKPRENLGVFFLCTNNSYHAAEQIEALDNYRKYVYIGISTRSYSAWA